MPGKRWIHYFACALAGFLIVDPATAVEWTLSSGGRTDYVIVKRAGALPAEETAARELADHLAAVTGAEFPIVEESAALAPGNALYVGQTDYAAAQGIDFSRLGPQQWIVKTTTDGNVILTGGLLRGVLYAVYEFLEGQAGCYWLDERNAIAPRREDWAIPALDLAGEPRFRVRQIFDTLDAYPETLRFKVRNRGQGFSQPRPRQDWGESPLVGRPGQHHTFFSYSRHFPSDHPELFSMDRKGKRQIAINSEGPGQICLTQPEARAQVLKQLRAFIAEDRQEAAERNYPPPVIYDISANDNQDPCRCPECAALAKREGSQAGPLLDFINDIAAEIQGDHPEIFLRTFAFLFSLHPPKTLRAQPNVLIHLAQLGWELKGGNRDTLVSLTDPSNREAREILEKWSQLADNLAIWDYWILFDKELHCPAPSVNLTSLPQDLSLYAAAGVKDVFAECENPYSISFFALRRFLGFQLLNDPERSAEALTQIFLKGYYGAAHATMKSYLEDLERSQRVFGKPLGRTEPADRDYLDREFFQRALQYLDQAEREAAGDPRYVANIRRERVPVLTGLLWRWDGILAGEVWDREEIARQLDEEIRAATEYYLPREQGRADRETIRARFAKLASDGDVPK